ncbi:MAG: hypothetical protein E7376_01525 [Clostridiales bacterium]|nr:hypothetical protein [Clostridiales bacterium]
METKTAHGIVDALAISGEVLIPLVILKSNQENSQNFLGFIPGFTMKTIVESSEDICKEKLKKYLVSKLKTMKELGEPFPFFPTRAEIMSEYDNVKCIEFVKVKSEQRKDQ